MASGIRWYRKLSNLKSIGEVIDYIDELETKSYYVSRVFSDSRDSLPYQTPTRLEDLPFLGEENVKISNFEKMIKNSNNFSEIGKFIERINCVSGSIAEKLVPLVCEKINDSETLHEALLCLNQIIGLNLSQRLTNSSSQNTVRDYPRIRLAALIVEGLDEKKMVKKLKQSDRIREVWECLHTLKISRETLANQVLNSLDAETIVEKLNKTKNPDNVGNLLRTLQEINPEKADLVIREIIEKLRLSTNLVYIATCFGGIANFDTNRASEHLPLLVDKFKFSKNLREVGEGFRKISLSKRSVAMELFLGLDEHKQNYLRENYGRYLKE